MKGRTAIRNKISTSRALSKAAARLALEKKAEDVAVLDMRKLVNFCDYFVLCSGNTDRHVRAIAEGIEEGLKEEYDIKIPLRHGFREGNWVLFDTGDVVVHIFQKKLREFYQLEYLWQEAPRVSLDNKRGTRGQPALRK